MGHSVYMMKSPVVAAWLNGNALVLINVVALRRARLVLGWVTVRGYTQVYSARPYLCG